VAGSRRNASISDLLREAFEHYCRTTLGDHAFTNLEQALIDFNEDIAKLPPLIQADCKLVIMKAKDKATTPDRMHRFLSRAMPEEEQEEYDPKGYRARARALEAPPPEVPEETLPPSVREMAMMALARQPEGCSVNLPSGERLTNEPRAPGVPKTTACRVSSSNPSIPIVEGYTRPDPSTPPVAQPQSSETD
jgi:hypothetical protein